jgi:phosphoribosylaminoimidazolecarboxamide formyltransferase/IMP cyclohydrolase
VHAGFGIVSTGGTAERLRQAGVEVADVAALTESPEVLDGRVKTLHPRVFAAILADLDKPDHQAVLAAWGLAPISVVAVNLYPFAATAARADATEAEVIEMIDIGGPSLLRAAAKNHRHVSVLVDPADYHRFLDELHGGGATPALRRQLAAKAFRHTAAYDATIARLLPHRLGLEPSLLLEAIAPWLDAPEHDLRYGENPHQPATLAVPRRPQGLAAFQQLQGKELSYNNLLDADGAWRLVHDLPGPGVAIVKHGGPCGAAVAGAPGPAFSRALATDPVSAFGGVVASSLPIDREAAAELVKTFLEVVIAPAVSASARELLATKKNLRVLEAPIPVAGQPRIRTIDGGLLVQAPDEGWQESWEVVSQRAPSSVEQQSLAVAWRVAKHAPSNAIVIADETGTVGIGGGQPSRVDACRIAVDKAGQAGLAIAGTGAGSDAFFPFPDGLELLASAGVSAVIQPGGSVRDPEVIAAADRLRVAMVVTGRRHFRH